MKAAFRSFFCMVLLCSFYDSNAQKNTPNSFRLSLKAAKTDSAKIVLYGRETWRVRPSNPRLAIEYGLEAIELAKNAKRKNMEVRLTNDIGYSYEVMGEPEKALQYYSEGYRLANEISFISGKVAGLIGIADAYKMMGNYHKSINTHLKAIALAKAGEIPFLLADAHNNLANVYLSQNRYELALENYQACAEILPDDNRTKAIATLNIGKMYHRLENFDKSIDYLGKASELAKNQSDRLVEAYIFNHKGKVNQELNNYSDALSAYNEALTRYREMDNMWEIPKVQNDIAGVYFDMGAYEKALTFYQSSLQNVKKSNDLTKCYALLGAGNCQLKLSQFSNAEITIHNVIELSSRVGDKTILSNAYLALSELYAKTNKFQSAYENQRLYISLKDSLFNEEKSEQIAEMEAKYETVQKTKEIDLLNAQNEISELQLSKRESQRNYLLILALIVLTMAVVLYYMYRIKARSNSKLQEVDQLKSRFFANISHEFRTPLTLILSPLKEKISKADNPTDKSLFEMMQRNASRLLGLINELLDLSKLESGKLRLLVAKNDINDFVKPIIASFASLAEQKGIVYVANVPKESFHMYFDKDNVQKILNNLLSNAFKFTPDQGRISVDISNDSKCYIIEVRDSGKGIPEAQIPLVFERFQQLENDVDGQQAGSGIGLALIKELVELHHGKIKVESEIDVGSVFKVMLPVRDIVYKNDQIASPYNADHAVIVDQELTPIKNDSESPSSETEQHERTIPIVLIVEDNEDLRNYIKQTMSVSYHVMEAKDGLEGKEMAIETVPDIIISDLMMPKMDGIELCDAIRGDQKTSHIPLILLTAKANIESRLEGLQSGADDYLTKPFDAEELLVRVKNLVEQRRKLRMHYGKTITLQPADISITPQDEIFLNKAFEIVEENISNGAFTVEQFQKEVGMSRMQLHRKLKALTDCSASEFIRTQRLKRSAQLLQLKAMNISEVAYASGFNNLSYFAKCFKEQFDISPSEYAIKDHEAS